MGDFNNIEKVCAFYVSQAHLSAMIIPYISKQIKNNNIIETFLENSLEKNVEIILSKIILDEKNKKEIKKINWQSTKNIEKTMNNILKINNKEINILINGNIEYINKINNKLNKILNKTKNKIKIINCYSVEEIDNNIKEIIDNHNMLLNTAGIKNIEEIFERNNEKKSLIG